MYSDFDHFSTGVDYGGYAYHEAVFTAANEAWVRDCWEEATGVELDAGVEAWSTPTPIDPEAVAIRAGVDLMLAAMENMQEPFTRALVEQHGEQYEPRLDPLSPHYYLAYAEPSEAGYDSRLDPNSDDYYLRDS